MTKKEYISILLENAILNYKYYNMKNKFDEHTRSIFRHCAESQLNIICSKFGIWYGWRENKKHEVIEIVNSDNKNEKYLIA